MKALTESSFPESSSTLTQPAGSTISTFATSTKSNMLLPTLRVATGYKQCCYGNYSAVIVTTRVDVLSYCDVIIMCLHVKIDFLKCYNFG